MTSHLSPFDHDAERAVLTGQGADGKRAIVRYPIHSDIQNFYYRLLRIYPDTPIVLVAIQLDGMETYEVRLAAPAHNATHDDWEDYAACVTCREQRAETRAAARVAFAAEEERRAWRPDPEDARALVALLRETAENAPFPLSVERLKFNRVNALVDRLQENDQRDAIVRAGERLALAVLAEDTTLEVARADISVRIRMWAAIIERQSGPTRDGDA